MTQREIITVFRSIFQTNQYNSPKYQNNCQRIQNNFWKIISIKVFSFEWGKRINEAGQNLRPANKKSKFQRISLNTTSAKYWQQKFKVLKII